MSRSSESSYVTICIVTFNSANDIEVCLKGVQCQTWPNLNTIIVDNASVDETIEVIKRYELNVQLISNSENTGFAAAQNQAIRSTDSKYVLVLNPDVVLAPDYVRKLVERLESDSTIGSATGRLTFSSDPLVIDTTGLEMNWARKAVERGKGQAVTEYAEGCEIFGVSGAAAMYSRNMINQISIEDQFFDEDFFAYKEDVDVAWRAHILGWKSWYEPEAKALHGRKWGAHTKRKQIAPIIRRHSFTNRYLMMIKNEDFSRYWWMRLPLLLGYEIALNGYLLLRDSKVLVGGWGNILRLLPSAWRKRKVIKAK